MPGEVIGLVAVLCIFGIPLSAIWADHRQKLVKLQLQLRQQGDQNLVAQVEALRQEVRTLRDTTMQYDLSFDSALQRMESRVEGLERRANAAPADNVANLNIGR